MSTILQPCFESQFIETATFKLKFTPSPPPPPPPPPTTTTSTTDVCGLSFQQVLAGICSTPTAADNKESIYVHPLSKRSFSSSSRFSEKSFEMCTENLGSETGTDDIITENDDFFFYNKNNNNISLSSYSSQVSPSSPREYSSLRSPSFNKNCKKSHFFSSSEKNFPPPLTTITGGKSIQVRSHREDGRLVMRAVPTPVTHTYLQAERNNGRLKLTLYNHNHNHHENDEINQIESDKEQEQEQLDLEEEEEINDNQKDFYYEDDEEEEEVEEEINQRDLNHIIIINEDECEEMQEMGMGMEKYKSISRRCNESGGHHHHHHHHHTNTVLYYKPLWVATS